MSSIQLVYTNSFRSIWEYEEAFFSEKIGWKSVIGPYCPVCGESCGYRELTEYYRWVEELWPEEKGEVPIARFQCLGKHMGETFSMLPHQLIPYQRYTVETILKALLLWRAYARNPGVSGTAYGMVQTLSGETNVTPWQLRKWLVVIHLGFISAHGELSTRYDFSEVPREGGVRGHLETVHGYMAAFSRGPPAEVSTVMMALKIYCQITERFLFGRPSQSRCGAR